MHWVAIHFDHIQVALCFCVIVFMYMTFVKYITKKTFLLIFSVECFMMVAVNGIKGIVDHNYLVLINTGLFLSLGCFAAFLATKNRNINATP